MRNFMVVFRQYNIPTTKELIHMLFTAFIGGFVYAFNDWGVEQFDFFAGLINVINGTIFVFILLCAIEFGRRIWATKLGYQTTFSPSYSGVALSLICIFYTRGAFPFILPGGFMLKHLPHIRIGKFQYGTRNMDIAKVAIAGLIMGTALVLVLGNFIAWSYISMLMGVMVASLVPVDVVLKFMDKSLKPSAGTSILMGSRFQYVFSFVFLMIAFALLAWQRPIISLLLALIGASIAAFVWFWNYKS